ncbi:MAG TPA: NrfD/PsrC family molybdoenzyme membrane anchor subunit [bacterium]|nr:NrfD/PsrC family molybdoenzyme membrane anchor subunit [bacterium]
MTEVTTIYNVAYGEALGIPIAVYFYLTGLSAGSFILSTLAYGFGMIRYKPLGKIGVVVAILLLIVAPLNLMIDLEQPWRFWELFYYINPTSAISYGSFLLTLYPINCMIYGTFMFMGKAKLTKIFGLIGIPLALSVHGYTGFILALAKARILWNTALMPFIFLASAMVSGIAMMILIAIARDKFFSAERKINMDLINGLVVMLIVSIVADLSLIGTDILVLLNSHDEAYEAAQLILTGAFRNIFLGGEILLGALVPLALLSNRITRTPFGISVASVLVMLGIFAMRYTMVIGGQAIPQH